MRKLLLVCHRYPYPPDRGEKIRAWHILEHLAQRNRVSFGCLSDDPADRQHDAVLRALCADVAVFDIDKRRQKLSALARIRPGRPLMLDYYRHAGLRRWVRRVLAEDGISIAYIYSTAMAPYLLESPQAAGVRRILDAVDIDSEKWAEYGRRARWPMRAVWQREARTLLAYERRAALACERTLFVSQAEAARFAELAPDCAARIGWLDNGVELDRFSPAQSFPRPWPDAAPRAVFAGNMDYWPNADAALYFAGEVLPLLQARHPALRFAVVGANPGPEVLALAASGVEVTGRVADVRPYVAHAAVSVAPLRIARGVQNKVLEAMALGRPVVATPQAFEGIRAEPGRDLLVAADAAEMAARVAEVLDGQHPGLGAAGRAAVERGYNWQGSFRKLDGILDAVPAG